jgi:hypothetical protein
MFVKIHPGSFNQDFASAAQIKEHQIRFHSGALLELNETDAAKAFVASRFLYEAAILDEDQALEELSALEKSIEDRRAAETQTQEEA